MASHNITTSWGPSTQTQKSLRDSSDRTQDSSDVRTASRVSPDVLHALWSSTEMSADITSAPKQRLQQPAPEACGQREVSRFVIECL